MALIIMLEDQILGVGRGLYAKMGNGISGEVVIRVHAVVLGRCVLTSIYQHIPNCLSFFVLLKNDQLQELPCSPFLQK